MTSSFLNDLNRDQERAYSLMRSGNYSEAREIFERLLEQGVQSAATYLGFIYSRVKNPEYDRDKAIHYYRLAPEDKSAHVYYFLGALLAQSGNHDEALEWYCKGSKLGHSACSYFAFREFKARGDAEAAAAFFLKALEQGNPAAIQRRSMEKMMGRFGLMAILPGLIEYIGNVPRMVRFVRDNLSYPRD